MAINVSKSTAVLFFKAARRIQTPRAVHFLGEPIQWVETTRYLGVTLDKQLTWSVHVNLVGKKEAQRLCVLDPSLTGEAACPSETVCCSTSSSSVHDGFRVSYLEVRCPQRRTKAAGSYNPSVFALRLTHLCTLVAGKFTSIWGFHSSPTTSEHYLRVSTQS
jgi:hypothetical protein